MDFFGTSASAASASSAKRAASALRSRFSSWPPRRCVPVVGRGLRNMRGGGGGTEEPEEPEEPEARRGAARGERATAQCENELSEIVNDR